MNLRFLDAPSLTSLTTSGGCAAKLGADVLAEALAGLGAEDAPAELIAGLNPPDDAAVYLVAPELAIIGTLDFFPPLVDDPRTFGEIAAANALSDVFAMGGRVLFALSIAAFPEELPQQTMIEILDGASSKVREAGGTLAGGHTIRDAEPKYGLAVIGVAHPDHLLRKGGARPGDVLLLTKPLGTGLIVSGRRQGQPAATQAAFEAAVDGMRRAQPGRRRGARGARRARPRPTSPGFGLLGHGLEMARGSGTRFVFSAGEPARARRGARARPGGRRDRRRRPQPPVRRSGIRSQSRDPGRARHPGPRRRRPRAACWRRSIPRRLPPSRRGWPRPACQAGESAGSRRSGPTPNRELRWSRNELERRAGDARCRPVGPGQDLRTSACSAPPLVSRRDP